MEQVTEIRELTTDETDRVSGGTFFEKVEQLARLANTYTQMLGNLSYTKSETVKDIAGATRG